MTRRGAPVLAMALALAALGGCAGQPGADAGATGEVAATPAPRDNWRSVATEADRDRLRRWRLSLTMALQGARAAGHGAAIDAEGALLAPDAAQGEARLPAGTYRCRVTKLGAQTPGMLAYIAYPAFRCRVRDEGAVQGFAKLSGSQRPVGLIFPDSATRSVFLGTLVLGDEEAAREYGIDPDRDMAGLVERIGAQRWRLLLPAPRHESLADVIELVPAS